ncbi:MAG TPA: PIN domain-containing protein [Acidothermales bacterium]
MTLVLDAGGVTALAASRARVSELRHRGLWPAQIPAVVLTEALTGDHRRDVAANRLLKTCQVRDVAELECREAARLRGATGRAGTISAVDAVVVAVAATYRDPVVVTSDPRELGALAAHCRQAITIAAV